MMLNQKPHSFHIPVMGTGYTIDTPIKVAHYGISSVISIIDHRLTEQMREYYSNLYNFPFSLIDEKEDDARAKRITAYLDLVSDIVEEKFTQLKNSLFEAGTEITKYFEMLSDSTELKKEYLRMLTLTGEAKLQLQQKLRDWITPGDIDVNIMTKIDGSNKANDGSTLPNEYNDAHAALRGFANSKLSSSVVFSAGLNPRLYSYMAGFKDFFPDKYGKLKKKVILKVSDYRSALIQGKFLAKKGIWISEYRIESGLNCGGHAFATDGYLMGPILEEFKENKKELSSTLFGIYADTIKSMKDQGLTDVPEIFVTAQGGVGTSEEHDFLLNHHEIDSIGWGSPFLLVPEAVSIDQESLRLLSEAKQGDYYLSGVSPLGVPFNTVRGNTGEQEKMNRVESGRIGAPCTKKHLALNTEFTEEPICQASSKYQKKKIDELMTMNLSEIDFKAAFDKIIEKMCLCVGLANGVAIEKEIPLQKGTQGVAICPGPNTAYFSDIVSLKVMVDHIYGRTNIITDSERPNMFVKELTLYLDYLKERIEEYSVNYSNKQEKYVEAFKSNLNNGIAYYKEKADELKSQFNGMNEEFVSQLESLSIRLNSLTLAPMPSNVE